MAGRPCIEGEYSMDTTRASRARSGGIQRECASLMRLLDRFYGVALMSDMHKPLNISRRSRPRFSNCSDQPEIDG